MWLFAVLCWMRRRKLVRTIAAGGTVVVAECIGSGDAEREDRPTDTEAPTGLEAWKETTPRCEDAGAYDLELRGVGVDQEHVISVAVENVGSQEIEVEVVRIEGRYNTVFSEPPQEGEEFEIYDPPRVLDTGQTETFSLAFTPTGDQLVFNQEPIKITSIDINPYASTTVTGDGAYDGPENVDECRS